MEDKDKPKEKKPSAKKVTKKKTVTKAKKTKKVSEYYIDNKLFGECVSEHVRGVKEDIKNEVETRPITNYIGECFLKLADGLSRSGNFINYTYREDMVMDAVENCIKYINNYDIDKPTRTGKPNAFSYFTQISYYAFLRRIAKEKKQTDIKQKIIKTSPIDVFADFGGDSAQIGESVIQRMRTTNPFFKDEMGPTPEEVELPKKKRGRKPAKKISFDEGPLKDFLK